MAAVISLGRPAALLGRSGWSRGRHQSKARRATEWPKLSFALSNGITSASVLVPMQRPSCASYRAGLPTTTRFTRTKLSDIVHPVSSSQLAEFRDRVRSFGGYNTGKYCRELQFR